MTAGAKIAGTPKMGEKHEFKAGDGVGAPCGRIDGDVSIHSCGLQCASGGQNAPPQQNTLTVMGGREATNEINENLMTTTEGDPKEEAAYQAFHKVSELIEKIKLGDAFLAKYPSDRYSETVYEELTQAYNDRKDLRSFYTYSDKGLSLFPDDVHLLARSGWVIPRAFSADEPDGDKKLDNAHSQEKRAPDVLGKMNKPANFTDQQFAEFKAGESAEAHSGLGLVCFRREKYDKSSKELQTAIAGEANPDQTDLFLLGADYENLRQFKEAADTFNRCAQIAGPMQDRCEQLASSALKQAAGTN